MYMQDFINSLATIIFGSVDNWTNFAVDNSSMYSEFFTSLIKLTPYIISIIAILFLLFLILFIFYKLVRVFV